MEVLCCVFPLLTHQQRDDRRNGDDGERAEERVGNDGSDDRKKIGATIKNIDNLSSVNAHDVELFNQIHNQVG